MKLWKKKLKFIHGKPLVKRHNQKQISSLHFIFHCLTVAEVLFCCLKKGLTLIICMLCFVVFWDD